MSAYVLVVVWYSHSLLFAIHCHHSFIHSFIHRTAYRDLVLNANPTNITVFAAAQTSLSFQRMYYDPEFGIFPYLTAIVDVQNGVSVVFFICIPVRT